MLGFLRSKDKSYLDSEDQNDPERETDLWYERECINVSAAFSRVLDDNGIEATAVLGLFHSPERSWGIHAWIELPTGEWIDPTSAASGLPECLVLTRDDDRREFYHGVMPKDHERAMENAQDIGVPVRVMLAERIGE